MDTKKASAEKKLESVRQSLYMYENGKIDAEMCLKLIESDLKQ